MVRVFVWCVYLLGTRRGAITGFPSVLRAWSFFQRQQDQSGFTSVSLLFLSVAPAALRMAGGFEALGLAPELVRAVTEDLGYLLPTNVQVSLIARQQSVDYAVVGACCWDTRYLRGASHAELDEIFCVRFSSRQNEPSYCCLLSC